jgi:D-alanyl-D-alanine carboxypeptidase/D-alanyl-D-alanine-endopeptidase (penicillin-binding protein 4)
MARHTRLVALVTLAMVNVVTLVAGIAVARMLPARLDALKIPSVAPGNAAAAGASPVLAPGGPAGSGGDHSNIPTASGLRAALTGPLSTAALGPHVIAMVADPATGKALLSAGGGQLATPASTTKVVTAVAALSALGGDARFTTRVVSPAAGTIVLVGGGDPTLAVNPYPAADYPHPATLASLAAATAARLTASGRRSVQLGYDTSLYSGAGLAPGWPQAYVTTGNVTQIVSLEVDQGRLTSRGTPEDSDDPYNLTPRASHPAAMAAAAFARLLAADGISVTGQPASLTAPPNSATVASVSSPPVSAIVEQMVTESNNVIAENLARQVAIATGRPATFQGAAAAVTAAIRRLGIGTPIQLVDGSGLSPQDGIAPATLVRVLEAAISRPRLRPALASLPVAGFSGTLAGGESVFAGIGGSALGTVRAKTGNLGSVATLAGLVYDKDGTLLAFAFMADNVTNLDQAATAIDAAATNLAACGCR